MVWTFEPRCAIAHYAIQFWTDVLSFFFFKHVPLFCLFYSERDHKEGSDRSAWQGSDIKETPWSASRTPGVSAVPLCIAVPLPSEQQRCLGPVKCHLWQKLDHGPHLTKHPSQSTPGTAACWCANGIEFPCYYLTFESRPMLISYVKVVRDLSLHKQFGLDRWS